MSLLRSIVARRDCHSYCDPERSFRGHPTSLQSHWNPRARLKLMSSTTWRGERTCSPLLRLSRIASSIFHLFETHEDGVYRGSSTDLIEPTWEIDQVAIDIGIPDESTLNRHASLILKHYTAGAVDEVLYQTSIHSMRVSVKSAAAAHPGVLLHKVQGPGNWRMYVPNIQSFNRVLINSRSQVDRGVIAHCITHCQHFLSGNRSIPTVQIHKDVIKYHDREKKPLCHSY